jgi:hypothetical protein
MASLFVYGELQTQSEALDRQDAFPGHMGHHMAKEGSTPTHREMLDWDWCLAVGLHMAGKDWYVE